MQRVIFRVNKREEEIMTVRSYLWMAEKLARLCREILRAKAVGELSDAERLAEEIEQLVRSERFLSALEDVSPDYFYPETLSVFLAALESGEADSIKEAVRIYKK